VLFKNIEAIVKGCFHSSYGKGFMVALLEQLKKTYCNLFFLKRSHLNATMQQIPETYVLKEK
jgi:hypothetical protein